MFYLNDAFLVLNSLMEVAAIRGRSHLTEIVSSVSITSNIGSPVGAYDFNVFSLIQSFLTPIGWDEFIRNMTLFALRKTSGRRHNDRLRCLHCHIIDSL